MQISIKDLARHIKQVPQYQRELSGVSGLHTQWNCLFILMSYSSTGLYTIYFILCFTAYMCTCVTEDFTKCMASLNFSPFSILYTFIWWIIVCGSSVVASTTCARYMYIHVPLSCVTDSSLHIHTLYRSSKIWQWVLMPRGIPSLTLCEI